MKLLTTYPALLEASGHDPVIRGEVGPDLIAPAALVGDAVLFQRENQMGSVGSVILGSPASVTEWLTNDLWRTVPGYADQRAITIPGANASDLTDAGARGVGRWHFMDASATSLNAHRRPLVNRPEWIIDTTVDEAEAHAFIAAHHTTRWLSANPLERRWIGLRENDILVAVGLASRTRGCAIRLSSIATDTSRRGQGLGRAITQAVIDYALTLAPQLVLGCDDDNVVASALYRSLGFRVTHAFASGMVPLKTEL